MNGFKQARHPGRLQTLRRLWIPAHRIRRVELRQKPASRPQGVDALLKGRRHPGPLGVVAGQLVPEVPGQSLRQLSGLQATDVFTRQPLQFVGIEPNVAGPDPPQVDLLDQPGDRKHLVSAGARPGEQ